MLKLKDIKKSYKVADEFIPALKGINLEFRKNEFVSILGPSGCGKTTLLNIIGGLDKYTSGDLLINNKSTKEFSNSNWDSYRNHSIGFVFQNYNLIGHLSILGNVELALTISGMNKEERRAKATKSLQTVGLEDHLNKRPNQLSGGQMQRVAIARAIVNDPEILLADEPTGALDTKTSVQIMDLIKEISKERLVIMVTHNSEIANSYSSRIVKLLDGQVIDDTNPYTQKEVVEDLVTEKLSTSKTSMNFFTALTLSLRNLFTKKGRTIITSIAGSIGIIGIALVLSISNGFNSYIAKMQADTLANYPISVSESYTDFTAMMGGNTSTPNKDREYTKLEEIYLNKVINQFASMVGVNNITDEYKTHLEKNLDAKTFNDVVYSYGASLEPHFYIGEENYQIRYNELIEAMKRESPYASMLSFSTFGRMSGNTDYLGSQYDMLKGEMPKNKDEIMVVLDSNNQLPDYVLYMLGLINGEQLSKGEMDPISFSDIMKLDLSFAYNDDQYEEIDNILVKKATPKLTKLKIVGIARVNEKTSMGVLPSGIVYANALYESYLSDSKISNVVGKIKGNPLVNPFTGKNYNIYLNEGVLPLLKQYGGYEKITNIDIYPASFEAKILIKTVLNSFNEGKEQKDKITYTDQSEVMVTTLNTLVDSVSYVLIAFTAISLIVSSVMIGIITYVSVIERTKEIGVLRSIGARKKDISRVFNAETFIIGSTAGIFGVLVAYILSIPINLIIRSLVSGIGNLAILNPLHALALILISVLLTLISGLVPSKVASNKDPVEALRTE